MFEHVLKEPAELKTLIRQFYEDGAAIMRRALLEKVTMLGHLLNVVGHVRSEIVAAQRQFTDGQLVATDILQDECLHVFDVADVVSLELGLDNLKKLAVHTFEQDDRGKLCLLHCLRFPCAERKIELAGSHGQVNQPLNQGFFT